MMVPQVRRVEVTSERTAFVVVCPEAILSIYAMKVLLRR